MAALQSINPSDDPEVESGATNYVDIGSLRKDLTDAYWDQIEKTLRQVFFPKGQGLSTALKRLERLKKAVNTSDDPAFPAAVYHLDPFQVAKDLAGADFVTTEQKEQYIALLRHFVSVHSPLSYDPGLLDQIKHNSLARSFPDDPISEPRIP
jgi:hypothetical protein